MRTIVAIGGGEIGRPGTKEETLSIDKHLISLTRKTKPKLLFIPTASNDSQGYIDVVTNYFGKKLGCSIDSLCLTTNPAQETIRKKIERADIIYVGGGNTKRMLQLWRQYNLPSYLRSAWENGTIMSGVSAGAICWFSYCHSDSLKEKTGDYCRVRGLGFVKGLACPHTIRESDRLPSFRKMVKQYGGIGYAINDFSALVITDDKKYVIKSKASSSVSYYSKKEIKKI